MKFLGTILLIITSIGCTPQRTTTISNCKRHDLQTGSSWNTYTTLWPYYPAWPHTNFHLHHYTPLCNMPIGRAPITNRNYYIFYKQKTYTNTFRNLNLQQRETNHQRYTRPQRHIQHRQTRPQQQRQARPQRHTRPIQQRQARPIQHRPTQHRPNRL